MTDAMNVSNGIELSLDPLSLRSVYASLTEANAGFKRLFPGESDARQAVHTVYGGAHLFKADTAHKMAEVALRSFREYAPDAATLTKCLGINADPTLSQRIYDRVLSKLQREAVEDFRIDFEDGYGNRPDSEEDGHARLAAEEVAAGMKAGTLPPFIGIRVKTFNDELVSRSVRTLDIFLTTLVKDSGGKLPNNFVVTTPKVTHAQQVSALVEILGMLETKLKLESKSLKFEIMVETPQSIISPNGTCPLPQFIARSEGRCVAAHFGVYDYTASVNITAAHQEMNHPACDLARGIMQIALAGTGIMMSDGATNIMPVGPHRAAKGGSLTPSQIEENREVVHRAWKLCFDHVRHSLRNAYYQGWDLHPAQLPIRYAAVYSFFIEGLEAASARLKAFMEKAAQATLVGDVFDDAATGQGLLNFFLRGMNCGAITENEATATGLTIEELQTRSFLKILKMRAASPSS